MSGQVRIPQRHARLLLAFWRAYRALPDGPALDHPAEYGRLCAAADTLEDYVWDQDHAACAPGMGVPWAWARDGDPRGRALADRHYSRKTGGALLFLGPGRKIVLVAPDGTAVWGALLAEQRKDGQSGWECTIFRNEGPYLSSHLIVLALGVMRWWLGGAPAEGIFTYVGNGLRGGCFHAAGFRSDGASKSGLKRLRLDASRWPPPVRPGGDGIWRTDMELAHAPE